MTGQLQMRCFEEEKRKWERAAIRAGRINAEIRGLSDLVRLALNHASAQFPDGVELPSDKEYVDNVAWLAKRYHLSPDTAAAELARRGTYLLRKLEERGLNPWELADEAGPPR